MRQFRVVIGFGNLSGQQQVGRGFGAELERSDQGIPGSRRIAAAIQLGQGSEGLGLGNGAGRLWRQQGRLLNLLPGFVVFTLMRQQQPQRQACFELLWVGGNGFAVVGGGGILVVAGILDIAKIKQSAGIAWVLAEVLHQQGARPSKSFWSILFSASSV